MRFLGRLSRLLLVLLVLVGIGCVVAPRERVDMDISFDPSTLGDDLDAYLAQAEGARGGITPGTEKRIVWAGAPGDQTPLSVIYIHGFSATSEEIRPVPALLAKALAANLYFTRLTGHGRDGAAMAEASAGDWVEDTAEALEIGRRIGERVIVLSTSTGGTLSALVALDPDLSRDVAGMIMVAPNFELKNRFAPLLALPGARYYLPTLLGKERGFEPQNPEHAKFWTTKYPSVAVFPMVGLLEAAKRDYSAVSIPALFVYALEDKVVSATRTAQVAENWGGPVETLVMELAEGDDPFNHVIMGDILSPNQTEGATAQMTKWVQGLP